MGFGCPICSERLDKVPGEAQDRGGDGDFHVSATPCGHMFHTYCIQKWLTGNLASSKQCPCCRKDVPKLRCLSLFPTSHDETILDDSFATVQCNHGEIINSLKTQTDRQLKEIEENKRLYELLSEDYTTVNIKYRDEKLQSDMWMMKAKSLESYKDQALQNEYKAKCLEETLKKYKLIESMVKDVKEVVNEDSKDFPPTTESIETLLEMKHVLNGELRLTSKKLTEANQKYEKLRSEKWKLKTQHEKTCFDYKELKQIYEISRLNGRVPDISPAPTAGPSRLMDEGTPKVFRFSKRRFHEPNQEAANSANISDVDSGVDLFTVPTKLKKHKGNPPKAPTKVSNNTSVNNFTISSSSLSINSSKDGPSSASSTMRGYNHNINKTINISSSDDDMSKDIVFDSDDEDDDFRIKGNVPGAPLPIRSKLARSLQQKAEKPSLGLGKNLVRKKQDTVVRKKL